jgi:hypothetical protein
MFGYVMKHLIRNQNMKKKIRYAALMGIGITLAAMSTGCALGDRHVALQYKIPDNVASPQKIAQPKKVAVVKFKDLRKIKEIGEVRNGYGMKTAKVLSKEEDLGTWVANAFCKELENRGFIVNKFNDYAPPGYDVSLSGSLNECYTAIKVGFWKCNVTTTVRATVCLQKEGVQILNKEYKGLVNPFISSMDADEYGDATEAALHDLIGKALPDIVMSTIE